MGTLNILIAVCLGYVALLFLVAFMAERAALRGGRNGCARLLFTHCRCRSTALHGRFMAPLALLRDLGWSF